MVVVESLRHVRLFATPGTAAHQASLSFTVSLSLLKFVSIESVMPSNHLTLCRPFSVLTHTHTHTHTQNNRSHRSATLVAARP